MISSFNVEVVTTNSYGLERKAGRLFDRGCLLDRGLYWKDTVVDSSGDLMTTLSSYYLTRSDL